jgi:hypothetical protein
MNEITFKEAMKMAENFAVVDERLTYLYLGDFGYFTTHTYNEAWLFKVYPGGRKVLSIAGKEMLKSKIYA